MKWDLIWWSAVFVGFGSGLANVGIGLRFFIVQEPGWGVALIVIGIISTICGINIYATMIAKRNRTHEQENDFGDY